VPVAGHPLHVDISDATGFEPYFNRHPYEPKLAAYIAHRLRAGDVFIDVGANVGLFSILAARLVGPSGRMVSFEPNPEARSTFALLAAMNRVSEIVEIVPLAVADATETNQLLYVADASSLSTLDPARSPVRHVDAFQRSIAVDTTTLDNWLARHPELAARASIIKIDVEGLEEHVIRGMQRTLRTNPDIEIVVETTTGSATDLRLRADGYTVVALDEYAPRYGNFVYRHPPSGTG
jgi:FkbM family methyltransferase